MNFFKMPFPVWELGLWGSRKRKGLDSAKGIEGGLVQGRSSRKR